MWLPAKNPEAVPITVLKLYAWGNLCKHVHVCGREWVGARACVCCAHACVHTCVLCVCVCVRWGAFNCVIIRESV